MNKITEIPNVERDANRAAIEAAQRQWPAIVDSLQLAARVQRVRYDAFLAEGFTEAQAIELCKVPV